MTGEKHPDEKVPKGDKFMEGISANDIRAVHGMDRYAWSSFPLLICLRRKEGDGCSEIADMFYMSPDTVEDWLCRMHHGGLDARHECRDPYSKDRA